MSSELLELMEKIRRSEEEVKQGYERIINDCIEENIIREFKFLWQQKTEHLEEIDDIISSLSIH
ncbi:hypothetical protein DRN74_03190 [Candidatus Micrarchaeota archaeon]|nr:MAG: hypothetical protein DRN74_03190 [Candidatus Micrarchaeota archaeon]